MAPTPVQTQPEISVLQLIGYFLRLGIIGFGGPPAHIAIMHSDLVEKQKWLTAAQFNEDLATANLLPGPTSTEMTIYIGYRLQGVRGAIAAGISFILPAFVIVLALSIAYVHFGTLASFTHVLYGIKPIALALVVYGTGQLGSPLLLSWREWALLALSTLAIVFAPVDILLLYIAAGLVMLSMHRIGTGTGMAAGMVSFVITAAPAGVSSLAVLLIFLKIGALIYGGGFALIGILQQELVHRLGWITQEQLLDAIAIGQATPGPVFTTATFVGYLVAGWGGAIAGTIGIFAPAFGFVILENKLLGRLKNKTIAQIFLRGVNIAVVASIIIAAAQLARDALIDPLTVVLFGGALIALVRFKLPAHWLVLIGLVIGLMRSWISG